MTPRSRFGEIFNNGLWKQNSSLAQLIGLCPLLAVTTNLMNGVMLSLATILVTGLAGLVVASCRKLILNEIRIPIFIMIAATLVAVIDQSMEAYFPDIHGVLGIFIPLIVTNCIVLARIEVFAANNGPLESLCDGVAMGLGMLWTLALLGGLRELFGNGTLFSGIGSILPALSAWRVFPESYPGFLLFSLPPGAFVLLALLIAGRNWLIARTESRSS